MMEHHFSKGRDLLLGIKMPAGAILPGSLSRKDWQKSARLPTPAGANFSTLLLGGGRHKAIPAKHTYVKFYI
jgi:hypothetical protein